MKYGSVTMGDHFALRHVGDTIENLAFRQRLEQALKIAGAELLSGNYRRNFAALAVCGRRNTDNSSRNYAEFLERGLAYEAWIGDIVAAKESPCDYLSHAEHKLFGSWRTGYDNGRLILELPELLVPDDSLWPGAIIAQFGGFAVSGLKPGEDYHISSLVSGGTFASNPELIERYNDYQPADPNTWLVCKEIGFDLHPEIWWEAA